MPIVRKRIYLGTYAVIDFDYKVTNSSPLTHKLTSKRLYFNYFKERLDHFYGTAMSAIHNAVKKPGNQDLNCILAGALADAMYGCEEYFVKKKFEGGRYIDHLDFVDSSIYHLHHSKRAFFPKNNARTNVERHYWYDAPCPFSNKVITPELKRRITKAFYTDWENRFGFYLDDGWFYVYRSFTLLARFKLKELPDGTYRIANYQKSDESKEWDKDDTAINCAMYSVEHRWDLVSNE